ncbi:hypothetical protein ACFL6E_06685 [Candidatus Neomarinimicrobiota bacterium]
MRNNIFFILALLMVLTSGCEETRPGVINNLIFNDDTEWVDRNWSEDPAEWVDGECCNDFIPYPLGVDTALTARIEPAADLDWFEIRTEDSLGGALFLSSDIESIIFRVFDENQQEYELLTDTLTTYTRLGISDPVYWTPLAGDSLAYYVLVQSKDQSDTGNYKLIWSQQQRDSQLAITRPTSSDILIHGSFYVIQWNDPTDRMVSLALLKEGVMVSIIGRNLSGSLQNFQYAADPGLEPDTTYRIMLYQSNDPQIMDISNVFEIRAFEIH